MRDREKWTEIVKQWHASGLTVKEFCEGREFTAKALGNRAHRLGLQKPPPPAATTMAKPSPIRIARVESVPARSPATVAVATLTIEFEGARVVVPPGFDGSTLRVALTALSPRLKIGGR